MIAAGNSRRFFFNIERHCAAAVFFTYHLIYFYPLAFTIYAMQLPIAATTVAIARQFVAIVRAKVAIARVTVCSGVIANTNYLPIKQKLTELENKGVIGYAESCLSSIHRDQI